MSNLTNKPILVPALGENIKEATVRRWLKKTGERVRKGETLVELETDKISMEVSAEHAGLLRQISASAGTVAKVGDCIGVINRQSPEPDDVTPGNRPGGIMQWIITQMQAIRAGARAGSDAYGPVRKPVLMDRARPRKSNQRAAEKDAGTQDEAAKPEEGEEADS